LDLLANIPVWTQQRCLAAVPDSCAENGVVQKMGCVEIGVARNWSGAGIEVV
jgi:hypothetical protein